MMRKKLNMFAAPFKLVEKTRIKLPWNCPQLTRISGLIDGIPISFMPLSQ
jgi:hypothetical protein